MGELYSVDCFGGTTSCRPCEPDVVFVNVCWHGRSHPCGQKCFFFCCVSFLGQWPSGTKNCEARTIDSVGSLRDRSRSFSQGFPVNWLRKAPPKPHRLFTANATPTKIGHVCSQTSRNHFITVQALLSTCNPYFVLHTRTLAEDVSALLQ